MALRGGRCDWVVDILMQKNNRNWRTDKLSFHKFLLYLILSFTIILICPPHFFYHSSLSISFANLSIILAPSLLLCQSASLSSPLSSFSLSLYLSLTLPFSLFASLLLSPFLFLALSSPLFLPLPLSLSLSLSLSMTLSFFLSLSHSSKSSTRISDSQSINWELRWAHPQIFDVDLHHVSLSSLLFHPHVSLKPQTSIYSTPSFFFSLYFVLLIPSSSPVSSIG